MAVDGPELRRIRRQSGLSLNQFARRLGLLNRSSLMQYETGSKPISDAVLVRLDEFLHGPRTVTIEAKILIPEGTILPDSASIATCNGCGRKFIRLNARRENCSRNCQARAWRRKRKQK